MMEKVARYEAHRLGLLRYYTGKPCIRGHICERITSTYACLKCHKIWQRRRRVIEGSSVRKYYRTYYAKNAPAKRTYHREWNRKNPHVSRARNRRLYLKNKKAKS